MAALANAARLRLSSSRKVVLKPQPTGPPACKARCTQDSSNGSPMKSNLPQLVYPVNPSSEPVEQRTPTLR